MKELTMVKTISIALLKVDFFIRVATDPERVLQLAELYESGVKLPPLEVTAKPDGDYSVIDGRHRLEALSLLNRTEVDCEVRVYKDRAHQFGAALKANMGGPQPITRSDIRRTIALMLSQGIKQAQIVELVPLPKSIILRFLTDVRSNEGAKRVREAKQAVLNGEMKVPEAVKHFNVEEDRLRKELGEKKGRLVRSRLVADAKASLRSRFKSLSMVNVNAMRRVLEAHEEGDIPTAQVLDMFQAFETAGKHALATIQGYQSRFLESVKG
jgi:hypothetical protein